ncbi:MAG: hypothetical protein CVV28_11450 [Methanobacteriales archaeon HGW-Methanobacteriales-1]|jgi:hypothetical protein|nr:MAG: hypothetical protein CVV28_11450 [Methanobacteriales archaeon HGW-Methanobacteriales-1]
MNNIGFIHNLEIYFFTGNVCLELLVKIITLTLQRSYTFVMIRDELGYHELCWRILESKLTISPQFLAMFGEQPPSSEPNFISI